MKICLVPYPLDEIETYLPLGVLTLATLLEEAGHEVVVVDPTWAMREGTLPPTATPDQVAELLQAQAPDLLGFSTICSSYPRVLEWARAYRQLSPHTPIVLGGPQATAVDQQTLRAFPWVDMVLRGEAENSIVPLAYCLEQAGDLDGVPGLTWRRGNDIVRNADAEPVLDLDSLPAPAYHLYPMVELARQQQQQPKEKRPTIGLEAGRGCPFGCTFCSTSHFFQRRYRTKSADRLIDDMLHLHATYGIQKLSLQHDLFTCNKTYILGFCRRLRERGLHETLQWGCSSRIDTVDERVLAEMAAAGCKSVFFGVETGSARMQRVIGKKLDLGQVTPIVEASVSLDMHTTTSFICGFPQESDEDLFATLASVLDMVRLGVHAVQLHVLAPLAGSELYQKFGSTLCFDGHFSDISFIRSNTQERRLVRAYPDIFASFYFFETPRLNRHTIQALAMAIQCCPRLLVALEGKGVDLSALFQRWPAWYQAHAVDTPAYYSPEAGFRMDFYRFLQESLKDDPAVPPEVIDLIEYRALSDRVAAGKENGKGATQCFSCDVLALMRHLVRQEPLTEAAWRPTTYLFTNSNGEVLVKRLTPTLERLLGVAQA